MSAMSLASSLSSYFTSYRSMFPASIYNTAVEDDGLAAENYASSKYAKANGKESKDYKKNKAKEMRSAKFGLVKKNEKDEDEVLADRDRDRDRDRDQDQDQDRALADESGASSGERGAEGNSDSAKNAKNEKNMAPAFGDSSSGGMEALRKRLRDKVESLRCVRGVGTGASSGDLGEGSTISKRAARKAEKKRREEARVGNKGKKCGTNGHKGKRGEGAEGVEKPRGEVEAAVEDAGLSRDLNGLDFGGIYGLKKRKYYEQNKSLANAGKKKSLESTLASAERRKKRLMELKAGSDADREKAGRMVWGDVMRMADGENLKGDNIKGLKTAIKKKDKKKAKSSKAWAERAKSQSAASSQKQETRRHNLDMRKKGGQFGANLSSKKIKDTDKDGRPNRPGFEGRKRDFINGTNAKGASAR